MLTPHLDLDLLRTLVVGVDAGSFARAAESLGRTQSAVSLQMRRLEEQAGRPLLQKRGRTLVPTEAGRTLLAYARRLLALSDEALSSVRATSLGGAVRVGLPEDFVATDLADVLGRFTRAHPSVLLDVQINGRAPLLEQLRRGALDLAFCFGAPDRGAVVKLPAVWVGPPGFRYRRGEAQLLAMCGAPCPFRDMAVTSLARSRIACRVAFTSPSLAGVWAAVAAGLGITVRTRAGVPPHLQALGPEAGLPKLTAVGLHLHQGDSLSPAAAQLREEFVSTLRTQQVAWH